MHLRPNPDLFSVCLNINLYIYVWLPFNAALYLCLPLMALERLKLTVGTLNQEEAGIEHRWMSDWYIFCFSKPSMYDLAPFNCDAPQCKTNVHVILNLSLDFVSFSPSCLEIPQTEQHSG